MKEASVLQDLDFIDDRILKNNILNKKYGVKISSTESYVDDLLKMYIPEINNSEQLKSIMIPKKNDMVEGLVMGQIGKWILLDCGYKDDVYLELKSKEVELLKDKNLQIGDKLNVLITEVGDNNDFSISGSYHSLLLEKAGDIISDGFTTNQAFDCYVRESTSAGYFTDIIIENIKTEAFMPNTLAGINKLYDPDSIVGETIKVMVENVTDTGFIVSRKKYLKSIISQTIKDVECGIQYIGVVTGTTDFGIFVEFNECLTGMIHKANIDPEIVSNISLVHPGDEISFFVKEILEYRNGFKLILSQVDRQTLWDTIEIGQILKGKVKNVKPIGILVQLDEETIGLVKNSELEKMNNPIYDKGYDIEVKVSYIQRNERKIYLTLSK